RRLDAGAITIALDEATTAADVLALWEVFAAPGAVQRLGLSVSGLAAEPDLALPWPGELARRSPYLTHPVFATHHSQTEMQRYMRRLEARDLSLTHAMIPLGSCTMKLNAAAEMLPITWPAWGRLHPFVPAAQAAGYAAIFKQLEAMLAEITGFSATSL